MKRATLKRRTPLKRGRSKLRARKPIQAVNRNRRAARYQQNYGGDERRAWVATFPCLCGGAHPACSGRIVNAHTVARVHAGTWQDVVPLSYFCHEWQGQHGWDAWHDAAKLPRDTAKRMAAYLARRGPRP